MTDWADEISNQLHAKMSFDSDTGGSSRERVAAALRKAKADGMREAIDTVFEAWRTNMDKDFIAIVARLHANAIEKGTE